MNNIELPKRKPTRLKNYDYSSEGAYFFTICAHNRKEIFSSIVGAIHESPLQKRALISKAMGYLKIWNYIDTNPAKWTEDCFYIE